MVASLISSCALRSSVGGQADQTRYAWDIKKFHCSSANYFQQHEPEKAAFVCRSSPRQVQSSAPVPWRSPYMARTDTLTIAQLVSEHEKEILSEWVRQLKDSGALQTGRITESELQVQAKNFLA